MARVKVLPREERRWSGGGVSVVDGKGVGGAWWCYGGSQELKNSRNIENIQIYRLEMEKSIVGKYSGDGGRRNLLLLTGSFEQTGEVERERE